MAAINFDIYAIYWLIWLIFAEVTDFKHIMPFLEGSKLNANMFLKWLRYRLDTSYIEIRWKTLY